MPNFQRWQHASCVSVISIEVLLFHLNSVIYKGTKCKTKTKKEERPYGKLFKHGLG